MHRYFLSLVVGTSLVGLPLIVGCDDKEKAVKTEQHTNPDGSQTKEKVESKTDSNGVTKESSSSEVKTPDGKTVDKSSKTTDANGVTTQSKTEHKSN